MTKIAIIGTGLSGLSAAHLLKDFAEITLFEKARGVGGRMSTRRAEPYYFDHGAQYFTIRTKQFADFINPLLEQDIIKRWNARYVKFKNNKIIERKNWGDEEPRYVAVPGMNYCAKFLSQGLNISLNTKIASINYQGNWQLKDEHDNQYSGFDWVICTAPAPQTIALIPESFAYYNNIKLIEMRACFSLMLGFEENLSLDFDAAHVTDANLSWIAVNSSKPHRPNLFTLIINSSNQYAEANIDENRDQIMQHLINKTSHIIGQDVSMANYKAIHLWRYANNADKDKTNPIFIDYDHKLAVCGDWCNGGRVEGAFTSAYNLAKQMQGSIL